jgi:hypothetical protein
MFPLESNEIGGRKLAETRFIDRNLVEVAISYHAKVAICIGHGRS